MGGFPLPFPTPMPFEDIPNRPRAIYNLFLHWPTGGIYALRKEPHGEDWRVTGCAGPRPLNEWRRTPLEPLEYSAELAEWAEEERQAGHFDLTG